MGRSYHRQQGSLHMTIDEHQHIDSFFNCFYWLYQQIQTIGKTRTNNQKASGRKKGIKYFKRKKESSKEHGKYVTGIITHKHKMENL